MSEKCQHHCDTVAAMQAVVEVIKVARAKGLHGVMILSPVCPACGEAHDFQMAADLSIAGPDLDFDKALAELLGVFAEQARHGPSVSERYRQ